VKCNLKKAGNGHAGKARTESSRRISTSLVQKKNRAYSIRELLVMAKGVEMS